MHRVAPVAAEFQIDPHWHCERDGFAAELRDAFRLLAGRHGAVESVVHLQQWNDAFAPAARIQSLVCRAAEPWISAFIALCVSARRNAIGHTTDAPDP